MALDTGSANVIPTITINDAGTADDDGKSAPKSSQPLPEAVPGSMPAATAAPIPEWFRIGWREVSGIDEVIEDTVERKRKSAFDLFMKEQYYGDWYHNAAIIVFVRFFASLAYGSVWTELGTLSSTGRDHIAFYDTIWFWLGMDIHSPCLLQHLLYHIDDQVQAAHSRRYSARIG